MTTFRLLTAFCLIFSSNAFLKSSYAPQRAPFSTQLYADSASEAFAHNSIRTDVKLFLTQRTIQSFIYVLRSCRDPHTVKWLENNYNFTNMENYHGTGAFDLKKYGKWDSIFKDMLTKPKDIVVIAAKRRGRGQGGWSKDNPHLEDRYVEFEIDIDPPALVQRMLSVRNQIVNDWIQDLDTLVMANDLILDSYYEQSDKSRNEECETEEDPECDASWESYAAHQKEKQPKQAYERKAMMLLSNQVESANLGGSPQRKSSFDLLTLLATQESVHRVLREYRELGEERQVSFEWLRQFYLERVRTFFDGNQEYGRADDFMDELLLSPPSMKDMNGEVGLVDPLRIAEDIIAARSEVAVEWKKIIEGCPAEQMDLQREILLARMGAQLESERQQESTQETAPLFGNVTGAFE